MPSLVEFVEGDIIHLFSDDSNCLIVQQVNCTSRKVRPGSFSARLAEAFPYADVYKDRGKSSYANLSCIEDRPRPGSIVIRNPPTTSSGSSPSICGFFAQYKMGSPDKQYYTSADFTDDNYRLHASKDTSAMRLAYFKQCSQNLINHLAEAKFQYIKNIVFPKFIGCHSAGGNWPDYEAVLLTLAKQMKNKKLFIINYNQAEVALQKIKSHPHYGANLDRNLQGESEHPKTCGVTESADGSIIPNNILKDIVAADQKRPVTGKEEERRPATCSRRPVAGEEEEEEEDPSPTTCSKPVMGEEVRPAATCSKSPVMGKVTSPAAYVKRPAMEEGVRLTATCSKKPVAGEEEEVPLPATFSKRPCYGVGVRLPATSSKRPIMGERDSPTLQ